MPGRKKNAKEAAKKGVGSTKNAKDSEARESVSSEKGKSPQSDLVSMEDAIEMLKTTRATFYRWLRAGKITGHKAGRQWRFERSEINRFLRGEEPTIALRTDIAPLIKQLQAVAKEFSAPQVSLPAATDVQQACKLMAEIGIALETSDMHISPHITDSRQERTAFLRYRIDGVLYEKASFDIRLLPAIAEQWKRWGAVDVHAQHPQYAQLSFNVEGRKGGCKMFMSFLPTHIGDSMTARYLTSIEDITLPEPEQLEYSPADLERILHAIQTPFGLVILNGPTGSGKTTTLYSCLHRIHNPHINIMTVEDPVEVTLPWVVQVSLNAEQGMTFAKAFIGFLRSDVDVIMVGEVRDAEMMNLCVQGALTGHLIFTTLHADESAQALTRMLNLGVPPHILGDTPGLIVSQRLVRKLCPKCSKPAALPAEKEYRAIEIARAGGLDWDSLKKDFRRPAGCRECKQIGYKGRTVVAETLKISPKLVAAMRHEAGTDELRTIAVAEGMTTMAADGIRKAAAGITTIEEAMGTLPQAQCCGK